MKKKLANQLKSIRAIQLNGKVYRTPHTLADALVAAMWNRREARVTRSEYDRMTHEQRTARYTLCQGILDRARERVKPIARKLLA